MVQHFDPEAVADEVAFILRPKGLRRKVTVPDVVGRPMSAALLALGRVGLRSDVQRDDDHPPAVEGRVVVQDPEAGTRVRRRSAVIR